MLLLDRHRSRRTMADRGRLYWFRIANRLAAMVDGSSDAKRVARKRAEVGHYPVLPEESVQLSVAAPRCAHHLAAAVDVDGKACNAALERAEGYYLSASLPKSCVKRRRKEFYGRIPDHLTATVNVPSFAEAKARQRTKVGHSAVTPPESV